MKLIIDISDKDYNHLKHGHIPFAIIDVIENAIPLDQLRQKSGHWIPIPYALDYETDAKCSLCHSEFISALTYNYCPNCGAKMIREAQDD